MIAAPDHVVFAFAASRGNKILSGYLRGNDDREYQKEGHQVGKAALTVGIRPPRAARFLP